MKFKKDDLKWGSPPGAKSVYDRIVGHRRWSVDHEHVFELNGKFYITEYSVGATESQDESPYDYEPDEIECPEVFPVEVTTIEYRKEKP